MGGFGIITTENKFEPACLYEIPITSTRVYLSEELHKISFNWLFCSLFCGLSAFLNPDTFT